MASVIRWLTILLFLSFSSASPGRAQDVSVVSDGSPDNNEAFIPYLHASGLLRTDYFSSSKKIDDEEDFFGATAQIKLQSGLSGGLTGKLEARFMDPDIIQDRMPSAGRLIEGYIRLDIKQADLRIGKQNIAWGRADALNPTDNLTPQDYTVLLPFQEDRRFGTLSIKLDVPVTPEYTVTLFTTPFFEPSKIPLPFPSGTAVRNTIPAHTVSNTEAGAKLNKTGNETDWSISYFHGFSLIPEITMDPATASDLTVELRYPELNVLGADFARNYGRYGMRAEAAYIVPKDYSSKEPTLIQPYLFYVLGADRTFQNNVNINMQLLGRWIQSWKDPNAVPDPVQRSAAIENAVLFGQQERINFGFTSRISRRWFNDTMEAEIFMIVYLKPSNSHLRPLISYAFTDRIKGSIGAEMYVGGRETYFGSIKSNQAMFAEIRYGF